MLGTWEHDVTKLTCSKCTTFWKKKDKSPPCSECDRPKLLPENQETYQLLIDYGAILSKEGISAEGIRLVLDLEEVTNPKLTTQKLIAYLHAAYIASMKRN